MSKCTPLWIFIGLLMVLILAAKLPADYSGWQPATCLSVEGCFCEGIRPGTVAQPVNAWSSLAFALAGFFVVGQAENKPLRGKSLLYAGALILIGLGSAFYHAALTFIGQFFDVLGMYLLACYLVVVNLVLLGWLVPGWFGRVYVGMNLVLAASLIWLPEARRWLFLGLIVLVLVLEGWLRIKRKIQRPSRYLIFSLGAFGLAFLIWNLDNSRIWCAPDSLLQGHAVWHLLGALAGWWMWKYMEND
jgi:hypothetical protein